MISKTLLYLLISFSVLFTSCSSSSRHHSSSKSYSKSKRDVSRKSSRKKSTTRTSTASSKSKKSSSGASRTRTNITSFANNFSGIPYVYGGKTPSGFDCSGFITHVYNEKGISLYGNSTTLSKMGVRKSLRSASKGDLLFFGKNGKVSHVAIIVNNNGGKLEVIHATSSRGVVQEDIAGSKYWTPKIMFVRDVLSNSSQLSE